MHNFEKDNQLLKKALLRRIAHLTMSKEIIVIQNVEHVPSGEGSEASRKRTQGVSFSVSQKCSAPTLTQGGHELSEPQVQASSVSTHSYQLSDTTGRKLLQYLSSQNKYLNEHNASPKMPVGPGQHSLSHRSQQLLRLSYPQKPRICNGDTNHCYDSHSGVTNWKASSLAEIMPTNDARLHVVSEEEKVCIPEYLKTFCFACRRTVKGKKILQHLLFGYMHCLRCGLNIRSCKELEKMNEEKHQCMNVFDEMHDLSFWNPDIFDFLAFQIWQHSHDRARGAPSSKQNLLKMLTYLKNLRPLFNVKPWGSVLRKCELEMYASNCRLPLRNICSESSIENAKRKPASEEGIDVALKSNNMSEHFIESDINVQGEVDIAIISCSSEGNTNASSVNSVNSESRIFSASVVEERSRGSVKSKVRPSVVLGGSKCLVRSESSSFSSYNIGIGSKNVIQSQTCSINTPIVKGYPKCSSRSFLKASHRRLSRIELLSQTEINSNSDSQKKFDARIDFLGGSVTQNLDGRSNYSQDSENLDLSTVNDPSPLCGPSNLYCDEKQLLINFQTVETTGLANVKCPEECPMCYTVLCPSRFHVNLKTFHLTSRCLGCGLFITITLGDCKNLYNTKRIYKRPGPKSKTNPLASKNLKLR